MIQLRCEFYQSPIINRYLKDERLSQSAADFVLERYAFDIWIWGTLSESLKKVFIFWVYVITLYPFAD